MVEGDAFALRRDELYLSLNCLDLFGGGRETQLEALRSVLRQKLSVKKSSCLSIINVGRTKQQVLPHAVLDVRHEPEPGDETHCGLFGLEYGDELVQDLIAESVSEVVSAYAP